MDPEFLFLVGGTLVSIFLHLFALNFVFTMIWDLDGVFLMALFRAIFLGAVAGVFVSAAFPPAQPVVAALIASLLMLVTWKTMPGYRKVTLVLINIVFAFGPPIIRAASGL